METFVGGLVKCVINYDSCQAGSASLLNTQLSPCTTVHLFKPNPEIDCHDVLP